MSDTAEKLESLFAKVRSLPEARQELAVEVLAEIADEDVYVLTDDERAAIEPALQRAKCGEFASQAEVDEAINKSWS
jgi:hypothetical protein